MALFVCDVCIQRIQSQAARTWALRPATKSIGCCKLSDRCVLRLLVSSLAFAYIVPFDVERHQCTKSDAETANDLDNRPNSVSYSNGVAWIFRGVAGDES